MKKYQLLPALAFVAALAAVVVALVQIGSRDALDWQKGGGLFAKKGPLVLWLELPSAIENGLLPGKVDYIIKQLELAEKNSDIKAVLFAVNSPGGAVATTKKLYESVHSFSQKKPIVAVVGDIAASGGYYVASACSRIVAYEGSVLGSIGVISIRLNIARFLERHGIKTDTIKAGRFKDFTYPFRDLLPEERDMYQRALDDAYQAFLQDVAEGRQKPLSQVEGWGEGRIYSGKEALQLEMIDALGGRDKGLEQLKELLKMEEELQIINPQEDLMEQMLQFFSGEPGFSPKESYRQLFFAPLLYYYPSSAFMQQFLDFTVFSSKQSE